MSIVQQGLAPQVPGSLLELLILSAHHGQELRVVYLAAVIHVILIEELLQTDARQIRIRSGNCELEYCRSCPSAEGAADTRHARWTAVSMAVRP